MKRLVQWSIDHHWMVIAMSLLLLASGLWIARDMPVDVFPDLTAPTVTVLTEGHGMAPEEMESLVTFPIEAAINGASDVRRVRSATAVGIAVVWVEFDWGTDIFRARQVVAEKLALVSATLPPQAERPILAPISSIMGEILFFAVSSDIDDPLTLRTVADTVPGHCPSGSPAREQCRGERAARCRAWRQPEHIGRDLRGRTARVRIANHRSRANDRRDR